MPSTLQNRLRHVGCGKFNDAPTHTQQIPEHVVGGRIFFQDIYLPLNCSLWTGNVDMFAF